MNPVRCNCSGWCINQSVIYVSTMIDNLGYNQNVNSYNKNSGTHNICDNDLNHQYLIVLKWSQTIETLCSDDMHSMMISIKKHVDLNADTVEWVHPLDFAAKTKLYDNPMWDEGMNGLQK